MRIPRCPKCKNPLSNLGSNSQLMYCIQSPSICTNSLKSYNIKNMPIDESE